jgi:periodic tryptophan protein 2
MYNYTFSNLIGRVYLKGNVIFTPDGNSIISPVGNRMSIFDLRNNKSFTFPFENNKNIEHIAISPNGHYLLSGDEDGRIILSNVLTRKILHQISMKSKISVLKFSPCGTFFIVALHKKNMIQLWSTPLAQSFSSNPDVDQKEFTPFNLIRTYMGHFDLVTSIQWSADARLFVTSSKDMTIRVYCTDSSQELGNSFRPLTLAGHRDVVIGAWWSNDSENNTIYSVGRDGACFSWSGSVTEGFTCTSRDFFNQKDGDKGATAKAISADFHVASNMLVVGFSNGVFGIYEMPFNNIHCLRYRFILISVFLKSKLILFHLIPLEIGSLLVLQKWANCWYGNGDPRATF